MKTEISTHRANWGLRRKTLIITAIVALLASLGAACSVVSSDDTRQSSAEPANGVDPGSNDANPLAMNDASITESPVEPKIPLKSFVGTPYSADSLANLDVGGKWDSSVAYRFIAERSGRIKYVRPHIVVNTSRVGYASGTGGTFRLSVVFDDGNGLPDQRRVVAVGEKRMELVDGHLPEPQGTDEKREWNYGPIAMEGEPLVAGLAYHLVFEQIDPDPVSNYAGVNLLYQYNTELGPRPTPETWGVSYRGDDGSGMDHDQWREYTYRFGEQLYTPILSIVLEDGYTWGNGYIEPHAEPESYRPVGGDAKIRVAFELADEDFVAQTWWLRALRTSSEGFLRATLTGSDGTDESVEIPAKSFATEMRWVKWSWATTLREGVNYNLLLTGEAGGQFSMHPIREGGTYGFEPASFFGGVSSPTKGGEFVGWHKGESDDIFDENDIMMAWTL